MTEDEIKEEKRWIAEQYSLDFMIDDEDIQEDHEIRDIILKEITKTQEEKIKGLKTLDGNLHLVCTTENGFISAVLHLLSYSDDFAKYFIQNGDNDAKKPFSKILGDTFRQMYRSTALMNDRKRVDITDLKLRFARLFHPDKNHDAYRFLVHVMSGVTRETVDPAVLMKTSKTIED